MSIVRPIAIAAGLLVVTATILIIVLGTSIDRDGATNPTVPASQGDTSGDDSSALPAPTTTLIDPEAELVQARVTHVTDGDTIRVDIGGTNERVRLIGVDAPEIEHPDSPADCFSDNAFAFLNRFLNGKTVWLEADENDRDRYGRLLRYVWIRQGDGYLMANELLVSNGYAAARIYGGDDLYADRFAIAEIGAIEAGNGLWSACVFTYAQTGNPITPGAPAGWDGRSDLDCGDFTSRANVQAFYAATGGPESDRFNLDVDHNGLVCHSRPPTDPIG